jgi:zinc transporter ZupT
MNEMMQRDVQQHITVLGWLYIVCHALFLIVGGFVFLLLTGIGFGSGDAEAVRILPIVGISIGLLLVALPLPGLAAGYGLLTHKPWARILAIVVGVLSLLNFPLGTIIGIYTFLVLMQPAAADYFATPALA